MRQQANLAAMMRLVRNHVANHFHANRPGPCPAISAELCDVACAAQRFRQHLAAASGAGGQSRARLSRRAARAIKLRWNLQMRRRKPHPLAANIVHVGKDRGYRADSARRLGSPRRRGKIFDEKLVHALISGKHLNRGPAEFTFSFALTCAQKLHSLTYNTSAQFRGWSLSKSNGEVSRWKRRKAKKMAESKTKPTQLSVAAFLNAVTDPAQRADAKALVKLMESASGEKPEMWGPSIIGFGRHHYRYESGREGDMPLIGFSPRKAATVLYGLAGASDSKALLPQLGKHTTGKGCLYIKKLADVDREVLQAMLTKSVAAARARYAKTA